MDSLTEPFDESLPDSRIGRLVDDRYKILEAMASGSMGAVFKGERVPVGKLVAIKFLHASFAKDSEFLARFERETRVMSKLAHPNCVSVVDFGVWEGAPYLVMEYVAGTTLRALLDQGPIPPHRALTLTRQIAAGLAHAHAQGIVHRDIKPANIIVSEEIGTGDHVRILDFGLARLRGAAGRDATQNNVVVGTPNYMAPEQTIGGGTIDARTDVYAVGVVLFEMIVGERPFRAEDTLALLGMHRAAPIPRIADRMADHAEVPDGVQELIDKAMAKAPEDRYQSAIELAAAIDALTGARATERSQPVRRPKTDPAEAAPTIVDKSSGIKAAALPVLAARSSRFGTLAVVLVVLGAGGAALWWFKLRHAGGAEQGSAVAVRPAFDAAPLAALVPDAAAAIAPLPIADAADLALAVIPDAVTAEPAVVLDAAAVPDAAEVAGTGSGSGAGSDEIEMDPTSAINPDPEGDKLAEDEAADAPATAEEIEKRAPPAPVLASTITGAVQQIKEGKRDLALASLRALWKKNANSAYIPFLLGNLYYDQRWWGVAMDHYKAAITKNAAYKGNAILNRNVIRMMASSKTLRKAQGFLRSTIGRQALPYLRNAAQHEENSNVRKQAASLAKSIR